MDYFKKFIYTYLNHLQIGRISEYWVKMFLTLEGFDVYSSEVDDKGIDFVVRLNRAIHVDIQVKSIRIKSSGYVFITKKTWPVEDLERTNLYLALILLKDGVAPEVYLIPASSWKETNALLCSRDYKKEGQKSQPEWGVNISTKNMHVLEQYAFSIQVLKIKESNSEASREVQVANKLDS